MDSSELSTTVDMAMLELTDSQLLSLNTEVKRMLEYFEVMAGVDLSGVEPTTHAMVFGNRVRADVAVSDVDSDILLENAPDLEDRLVAIPNVL
jgi:aspartyl-tRNA(Asn)/glutamyl-tRNA(Gln) amidotransferase subunit C